MYCNIGWMMTKLNIFFLSARPVQNCSQFTKSKKKEFAIVIKLYRSQHYIWFALIVLYSRGGE